MTKEKRREIYWKAYCFYEGDEYCDEFACHLLCKIARMRISEIIIDTFPEFHKVLNGRYTLGGAIFRKSFNERRQKAILKAIELTY